MSFQIKHNYIILQYKPIQTNQWSQIHCEAASEALFNQKDLPCDWRTVDSSIGPVFSKVSGPLWLKWILWRHWSVAGNNEKSGLVFIPLFISSLLFSFLSFFLIKLIQTKVSHVDVSLFRVWELITYWGNQKRNTTAPFSASVCEGVWEVTCTAAPLFVSESRVEYINRPPLHWKDSAAWNSLGTFRHSFK